MSRGGVPFTPEEAALEQRAGDRVLRNAPALAEEYGRKFGNEIGTDNAREIVSPEYAASQEARTRWSRATQKAAGALSDYLFDDALRNPDPEKPRVVLMTAGGTGAGKTTALRADPELGDAQFIYDSNLSSKKSSVARIEAAKAAGNRVKVLFVHRDPVEALTGGVLPRAMNEGRIVDLEGHARMYRDSAENFGYLVRKYSGDPEVRFTAFDNTRGFARGRTMPLEETARIRYSTSELRPKLRAALENEYSNGRISEPVYRATLGSSSPEASGGVSRNPGPGGPQTGSTGPSVPNLLGNSGRVAAGEPESERLEGDGSPQSGPGSLDPQSQPKAPNPIKQFLDDESGTSNLRLLRSFRAQLTALYLAFFSLLFLLFSIFLYGELSRSLTARLEDTLASEAETAAVLFPDELEEMKGDASAAAREVIGELKVHGDFVTIREGSRVLAASPQSAPLPRDPIATRTVQAGGRTYQIAVSAPLDAIRAELAVVRRAIFIALPLILALAGLGGYGLATRCLRPLGGMAEQARRITGSNLETRIEIPNAAEELAVLVTSFNELLSRLDQSFDTMRRFVADASHELRTPISVIRGEADVALSQERSPAEYRESLAIVLDESRRLSRLVDDLLNLARADAGHVQIQTHDFYLNELLAECCRSVQGLANTRGLALECLPGNDLQFTGDEQLLRRLTINLLDNAIRYTPSGGKVTAALEAGAASVQLRVSDTGIGIAPADRARIFERFYRAGEARSRQDGGFGLGLAIVRWIAESHRGTVDCASDLGRGSTFTVSLPR
jgi:heavy metal sensor kinase